MIPHDLMAPLMFGALVLFMLVGYPVAFSLGAVGLLFGYIGIEMGFFTSALLQALPDHAAEPALLTQFRAEAEITGRLDHPGVVPVYSIGEDWNGRPFYVMRLIKGREFSLAIQDYHSARKAQPDHRAQNPRT